MKTNNDFRIGDAVSVVNDTMIGQITKIEHQKITITCNDGFMYSFHPNELVVMKEWDDMIRPDLFEDKNESTQTKQERFRSKKGTVVKEIDLHIHELIDSEKGMSNYDKLSLQLRTAKNELELAIDKKQQKIIFIHGRGEGVLRNELRALCKKYPVSYHDASYTEYGIGATEVLIFQNKK